MIAWFARNDVAANLLMIAVTLLGAWSLLHAITVEIFPPVDPRIVRVSVSLRDATPEDAELGLAVRVEEALEGIEGVRRLTSHSVEGGATVAVEVAEGYDPRVLLDEVKTRVDAVDTFPVDAESPVIGLAKRTFEVIEVVVAGPFPEAEIRRYAERVREDLLGIDGISEVSLGEVRRYEIAIEAAQDRLREHDLTLTDIAQAIRSSSVDISAGNVRALGGNVLLRSKGQAYRRSDFEAIVVKTNAGGSIVRVADVAEVRDGFEEDAVKTTFDGNRAALVEVRRAGGESALRISEKVRAYVAGQPGALPAGMTLTWWDDEAEQLESRLGVLGTSAVQGAILVIGLLALFLRPMLAAWVFIGIPISFLGAFTVMALLDVSLNLMSTFGFIMVLGVVVDDAIVTGESVYRRLERGESGIEASVGGARDVAVPVTFGALTTMVAFTPMLLVGGRFGAFMGPVAAVVLSVLLFSLVECRLVLPAHLKRMTANRPRTHGGRLARWQRAFADGFERGVLRCYRPALDFLTFHRYATLAAFAGVLFVVVAVVTSGWTRFVFLPQVEGETITAELVMPAGTRFPVTDRHVTRMLEAASELQAHYIDPATGRSVVKHVLARTGSADGPQFGQVEIELEARESRPVAVETSEVARRWRRSVGPIPGAESLTFDTDFFDSGDPIDVQLSGHSLETLAAAADAIKAHLAAFPAVHGITDSLSDGKEELRIEIEPQGHVLGLTRDDLVSQVGQAFKGFEVQRIQRGRDEVRVLVRLPAAERADFATLDRLLVRTPAGAQVPLSHVAALEPGRGPQRITRVDRRRTVNIVADVDKATTDVTLLRKRLRGDLEKLLARYPGVAWSLEGEAGEQREAFDRLQSIFGIVLFAMYCMLALPLKSYWQPLIVMSVIPFGVIGAVAGHWVTGYALSGLSVMGFLALTGVMVNDSLVLVHALNRQRARGESFREAALNAGVIRFRPIVLTSLTTFCGLMPLLLERSTTAQLIIPMAVSLGFGILFATVVTLVLVPVNLFIARDMALLANRIWRWLAGGTAEPGSTA